MARSIRKGQEEEMKILDEEFKPTRWWRVISPDGKLWCETSDEKEARESMRPGDKLQRLHQKTDYLWGDTE
jgi:hypothetical protein